MLRNYNDLKSIYALITSIKCRQIFGLGYRDLYVVRGMKGDVDVHVAGIGIGKKQDIRHCKPGCSRLVLNDPNGVLCNLVAERCNDLSYSYAQHTQTKSFIRCFNRFCRIRQEATYRNRWGQEREMHDLSIERHNTHIHTWQQHCNAELAKEPWYPW